MKRSSYAVRLFAAICSISLLMSGSMSLFANWGMEAGRANEGDHSTLLSDQLAMMQARNRIDGAVSRPLAAERQRELLGKSAAAGANAATLLDEVYKWWLADVIGPAKAIASNPAASCAEAQVSMSALAGMMRQRQLMGMSSDDSGTMNARDAELTEAFNDVQNVVLERCRDEAFDECVATGRISQIPQTALAEARQLQLQGSDLNAEAWAKDALKKCGYYELHFVSTTHLAEAFSIDTVIDGKIKLKFEDEAGGPFFDMSLKGETEGADNPFITSIKCQIPGIPTTCSPGATPSKFEAKVLDMQLKHREFYVAPTGTSAERVAGDDKIIIQFRTGTLLVQAVMKPPNAPSVTVPFPVGTPFFSAHIKDRVGTTQTVKFERNQRGLYPLIFDFMYADQNSIGKTPVTDSTHYELVHKIPKEVKDKLYPPRKPQPDRKPQRPRPGVGN
jgi:hypothetical protein